MPRPPDHKAPPQPTPTREELQDELLELLVTKIIEILEAAIRWVDRH